MPTEPILPILNIDTVAVESVLGWVLLALSLIFIIHAIIVTYHWYTFGSERFVSILSSVIYVAVGAVLLLAMGLVLVLF